MALLTSLRSRAPWVAGAVLLALVGLPSIILGMRFGLRYWPYIVGAVALLVLLAGWVERVWQTRPLRLPRSRSAKSKKSRFRVIPGGRAKGRPSESGDDDDDKPQWLM
jgi:protein-S-isoprenylcysteine O-methyltransferase Ste14